MAGPGDGARWPLLAAMFVVAAVAWAALWQGAGMGMSARDMTVLSLFPHLEPEATAGMKQAWPAVAGMWLVMMTAMMLPAALPLILLGERVMQHHGMSAQWRASAPFIAAGYLTGWATFSIVAALLQHVLEPAGLLSPMFLWSRSGLFSAAVLLAAGAYQLSPLKNRCLTQCRSPAEFLMRHWRPGPAGGFMLGLRHGAWCVGCCWAIMALLFVFGVMNLVWICLLALFVLAEKLSTGTRLTRGSGVLLLAWAAATLVVDALPAGAQPMAARGSPAPATAARMEASTRGKVLSVDRAQGLVELNHGEIPHLGMPAMAMVFQAKDPSQLATLEPGDPVRFRATVERGTYYVTDIQHSP